MLHSSSKRPFVVFCCFLILVSALPFLLERFLFPSAFFVDFLVAGILSLFNTLIAGYFAVSGKEGTFKQLLGSIFFRILTLAVILFFLILNNLVEPLPLLYAFIGFYLLHQLMLIFWMKKQIQLKKGKSPSPTLQKR